MSASKILVTGGAQGVGRALVTGLLDAGSAVVTCDVDEAGLASLAAETPDAPLTTHVADVGVRAGCEDVLEKAFAEHPDLDGLVNNAGLYLGRPFGEYDDETLDRVIAVNVKGPLWLTRTFASRLVSEERRGAVVNVASVAGEVGSSDAPYGTVKSGVIGMTKSQAMNYAPLVRVNCVSPGLIVNTAIADRIPEYRYREYKRQELLDGDILPENVADVCSYLLSDASVLLTGAVLRADNGCYPR